MAPEFFLASAAENLLDARNLLKMKSKGGNQGWTLTHMQFALARGFYTRTQEGDRYECDITQLEKFIKTKSIDVPPITEEELQARGKGDVMVKLIALLQIIWFAVQTLFRGIQHYQITALEIMTVTFVFCTVFTYGMRWYQPQDVLYPVVLEICNVAPATEGITPAQNRDRSRHLGEDASTPTRRPARVQTDALDTFDPKLAENLSAILFGFFACGFGALHCLAWNSPFPTLKEKLAWRICSATTTYYLLYGFHLWSITTGISLVTRLKVYSFGFTLSLYCHTHLGGPHSSCWLSRRFELCQPTRFKR